VKSTVKESWKEKRNPRVKQITPKKKWKEHEIYSLENYNIKNKIIVFCISIQRLIFLSKQKCEMKITKVKRYRLEKQWSDHDQMK